MRDAFNFRSRVHVTFGGKLVRTAKSSPESRQHGVQVAIVLDCLSVRREVQRLMISLSFRGAILLTRRRSAEEVLDVCLL